MNTQREKAREKMVKINEEWLENRYPSWTGDMIHNEAVWMQKESEAADDRYCKEHDC